VFAPWQANPTSKKPIAPADGSRHIAHVKILFHCSLPFSLAHGGQAIQIQRTMAALAEIGVAVEPLRWWDEHQQGDLIHYVGIMPVDQINFARQKKIKVVIANLLTEQGSQTPLQRGVRRVFRWGVENFAPRVMAHAFGWESYRQADALVALTSWEKQLMEFKFGAQPEKVFVIPNGVEPEFFAAPKTERGEWLVCTATITGRKRVLELAQAAVVAQTPTWIIGKAYAENEPYAQQFFALAKQHPQFIRYEGSINDRAALAKIYRAARGFVLLSSMESLSLSALEAAACECPLLLSDLPWARSTFAGGTQFCPVTDSVATTAAALKKFYAAAPSLPAPPKPATWTDVARQFKTVYEKVLAG
jgi:glycosyltransferase involved in cell wall biosynthesis